MFQVLNVHEELNGEQIFPYTPTSMFLRPSKADGAGHCKKEAF